MDEITDQFRQIENWVHHEFDVLSNLADDLAPILQNQLKLYEGKANALPVDNIPENYASIRLNNFYSYKSIQAGILYPRVLWGAIFLAIYSHLEYTLDLLCDFLVTFASVKIKPRDLGDHGIKRSRLYLEKVLNIHCDSLIWRKLIILGKLRDEIFYNRGIFDDGSKNNELKKYILEQHDINIDEFGFINFGKSYIDHIIGDIENTVDHIFWKVMKYFPELDTQ